MSIPRKQRFISLAKALGIALLALTLAGIVYEQIGRRRDRNHYPQIGQSIDIGGRTLNIFCSGEGSPTVILDSGGHTAGYTWIGIQPEIAKLTRTCWYDRAGYGWSDPPPTPRTSAAIANELHALLHAAEIAPPYVLVGATSSSFHVRVYNSLYPDEVAGAVLIETTDTDVFAHSPAYMKGSLAFLPPFLKAFSSKVLGPAMLDTGLLRLMGNPGSGQPFGSKNLTPDQQTELSFLSKNPETVRGGEGCDLEENMAEVRAAGGFGDRPLVVLASSQPFKAPGEQYAQATAAFNDYWFNQLQPRLAALSAHGDLVLVTDPEGQDAIISAVEKVVSEVRTAQPNRY
jgi:pimeloyl-ACP methyl ester carboxylesterase